MKAIVLSKSVVLALALLGWAGSATVAAAQYDATADWSSGENPNGVWSYWVGGALAYPGTRSGDTFSDPPGPPPIWTVSEGDWTWYGWSKSNGSEAINGWDLAAGDIYGHTAGTLEIRWTSPMAGPIAVSGGVWAIRDIGRSNNWDVTLNGMPIVSGSVYHGDPYSRANPAPINLSFKVVVGDVVAFRAWPGDLDYIALTFSIASAPIEVEVAVKPDDEGSSPINPRSAGMIPVVIFGSEDFDVSLVNPLTLRLEGLLVRVQSKGKTQCAIEDVDGDGYPDLVCHFVNDPGAWPEWMTTALLTGCLWDGTAIKGTATIRVVPYQAVADITGPGDVVQGVPNDGPYPGYGYDYGWPVDWPWPGHYETPNNAIDDNIETKFLHFKGDAEPTGIRVTPSVGATIVTRLSLTTANDAPGRDPVSYELYGSNEGIDGPYTLIASGSIVDFAGEVAWPRLAANATPITFYNSVAYTSYQLLFPTIRVPDTVKSKAMQIAEVEIIGVVAR